MLIFTELALGVTLAEFRLCISGKFGALSSVVLLLCFMVLLQLCGSLQDRRFVPPCTCPQTDLHTFGVKMYKGVRGKFLLVPC